MLGANDVANLFIYFANECADEPVTNLRLNKLLWFANGHSMERFGKPLFADKFEAWDLGPVVPSIYRKYKICGNNPIAETNDGFDPNGLDQDVSNFLIDVAEKYNDFTTTALVNLSHRPDTPWALTEKNKVIPNAIIRDYFLLPILHLPTLAEELQNNGVVPLTALPASWKQYDDEDSDIA
jgi:uncharacterized phage-associated protein